MTLARMLAITQHPRKTAVVMEGWAGSLEVVGVVLAPCSESFMLENIDRHAESSLLRTQAGISCRVWQALGCLYASQAHRMAGTQRVHPDDPVAALRWNMSV